MANLKQQDLSGGMVDLNVSLAPPNTLSVVLNADLDREIGSAVSRLGTGIIGSQLVNDKPILGLHQHIDTTNSSNNKLFAVVNDSSDTNADIHIVGGAISLADDTQGLKTRFLTYNGATLRLNGTDDEKSYTSAGWIATAGAFDLANIPGSNKNKYPIEFLDRVYLAGDTAKPTRLYYSGVSDGSTVSWTSGNGFVDIEPEDGGGALTGLGKVPGYILVFKERSMHRWNFSSAFPESLVQIGTPSHESIVMGSGLCAFYSNSNEGARGFYITDGSRPVAISHDNNRPIKKWVDAIASGTEANISGWATDRYFCWSVGDLTVDGEIYNNVILKYNFKLNHWVIRTYPTEFKFFAEFLVSGVNTIVGGDDDGTVYRIDKTDTHSDALLATTVPISYKIRQNHLTYGDNKEKSLTDKVVVRGKNIKSAKIRVYVDENLDPIQLKGQSLWKRVLAVFNVGTKVKGSTIALEVAGDVDGAHAFVREFDLVDIRRENNYT